MGTLQAYFGPAALIPLWCAALAGWGMVASGIWRGLTGQARRASLFAHVLTLGGITATSMLFGYGLLQTTIAATAGWWALVAVTGARPERLLDPEGRGLVRLAAWSSLSVVLVVVMRQSLL
ncbi:hypothetical protein [Actinomadura sp. HBU206391]|uniref:hypothetical protein n=1 Tax=Actinomadura sp. HBU206391 TaxID=2731692 RepID=UPI001650B9E1|nr:hypothetical protein [Actinomadura sp. HBU206391]MBC6462248.1 hypothetical protein [Actinomadura sp. HBU206391]